MCRVACVVLSEGIAGGMLGFVSRRRSRTLSVAVLLVASLAPESRAG